MEFFRSRKRKYRAEYCLKILGFLLLLLPFVAPLFAAAAFDDISAVPLISTQAYDPKNNQSRGFDQFISTVGGALAPIAVDIGAKIESQVLDKLNSAEMAKYFPTLAERKQIAARISGEVKKRYFPDGSSSNAALIQGGQYTANELIRTIVTRVMEVEGARDPKRRAAWSDRLLQPINSCIKASVAFTEATKCVDIFQADLPANLGQAIGFELMTQELGPATAKQFPPLYSKCLQPGKPGAGNRAMGCVLNVVRASIGSYGKDKAFTAAKGEVDEATAKKIVAKTGAYLDGCLASAAAKNDFRDCGDRFTIITGAEIAGEAVRANPQVLKQLTGKNLQALVERTKSNFTACMENNLTAGKRDASGSIDVASCAGIVRYDAAKVVAYELFRDNIEANLEGSDAQKDALGTKIYSLLDKCWNSAAGEGPNNACLRQTAQQLVSFIADPQLAKELPATLVAKEPKYKETLLAQLRTCLDARLPTNMMEADDTNERVAGCTGKLMRDAALKIAEFQFREVLFGRVRDTKIVDGLVNQIIKTDFAGCLGASPIKSVLNTCSIKLRIAAGEGAAEALIPAELDRFLADHGGAAAYELSDTDRTKLLDSVLTPHRACLEKNGLPKDAPSTDRRVDACFKATIKSLSSKLAKMEFLRSVAAYIPDKQAQWADTADQLVKDFTTCQDEKDDPKFSLRDYLTQVDDCRVAITTVYTIKLAQAQVHAAILANLPSATSADRSYQADLEKELMRPFETCVSKVGPEDVTGVSDCTQRLQSTATERVAIDAGHLRAQKILNTDRLPTEVIALQDSFHNCLAKKTNSDTCAKGYARQLAKTLAGLRLRQSLADVLGKDRYEATQPAAQAAETAFQACVDERFHGPVTEKFMSHLDDCSKQLEESIIGIMQGEFVAEMEKGKQGAEAQLNHDLAVALPCFGDLLPPTPIESGIVTLDPEGFLNSFAKMMGDYIGYDVEKAGADYQAVLLQLVKDMEAAGPAEARQKLLQMLIDRGMVDRLLKSMVRARIQENLAALPKEDQLPPDLAKQLLDKATVEKAISPEILAELRPIITNKILKPMLIEGKGMADPQVDASMKLLEGRVMDKLLTSPHFGDLIVQGKIQQNIDSSSNMFTRFAGRWFAGYQTFTWSEARTKPKGQAAEAYLRDQILRPRLNGEPIPDFQARMDKVSAMVKEALQSK